MARPNSNVDLGIIQTSSPATLPNDLQHLINTEQSVAEVSGGRKDNGIVLMADLKHLHKGPDALLKEDLWLAHYSARIDSYSVSDVKRFIWGLHAPDLNILESSSSEQLRSAIEKADWQGAQEVGFRSGLAVGGSANELSRQVIAHVNYGDERLQYALTTEDFFFEAMHRLARHPEPEEMDALRARGEDALQRGIIFRDVDSLPRATVIAIQGLHAALDARFIDLLKEHKIDQ